jgi:DNA-binding SARP family transcriptional activator
MTRLQIKLLGGFSVQLGDQPVTKFRSAKARALLAYLAAQPDQDHARTTLATLLWGELPDATAATNLRIELSNLNKLLLAHPALTITRTTVCLHSELAIIDVARFRKGVAAFFALPAEAQAPHLGLLAEAIDHYQGQFLTGFSLSDALDFDEWQLLTQEQLHEQMMQALTLLQQRYAEQARWVELAAAAQRQLAFVPWQESAHRSLIQALAAQGQFQAALSQYAKCRDVLQTELGVETSLATQEILRRLRDGQPVAQPARHNLTQQLKSIVGREAQMADLLKLIQHKRLVTLLGIGGVGKSRLAQAVAQQALPDFAAGVWFVPLANIAATEAAPGRIALAIAAAIGFPLTDMQRPLAELVTYLADQPMLLVLDNWEHLLATVETFFEPLLSQTRVHVLATSRARLMVEGEHTFLLEGLGRDASFTLFVERARRLVPSFASGASAAESVLHITRICDLVAGLPLGIELAASWVEHFSAAEIAQSLAELEIAPTQANSLVQRHHDLSSVFEYSWRLLNQSQQQILAALSIFRGGFDRTAAATVAHSHLTELSALIAHSLVQRVTAGRYDLHPLVQEFAARKVAAADATRLAGNHSQHYLSTLTATPRERQAGELLIDFENIRRAWQEALALANAPLLYTTAPSFGEFMAQFGLTSDGETLFRQAVARFEGLAEHHELLAHLLDQQSRFARGLRGRGAASALLQRLLPLTTDVKLLTQAHLDLANYLAEGGEWAQADHHFDQAEALAQQSADLGTYIGMVEGRIHIHAIHFRGDFAQGIARLEELLALLDRSTTSIANAEVLRFRLLQSLSLVAIRYRDYALSIRYARQALAYADALGHRQRKCFVLLDLALAEQFAGLYPEAIAHNQASLALAEEIGDADEIGLLKANLCLTLRQCGDLEGALAYGLDAIKTLQMTGSHRIEAQAHNRVGHTLLTLKHWGEAYAAYGDALEVWQALQHPNRYEAVAGRAVAAFRLGNQQEALGLVQEVLAFVAAQGLTGIVEPVLLLLNCETVLTGLGHIAQAHRALQQADDYVQTIANRISDAVVCTAFLHNRPDNQLLKSRLALVDFMRRRESTMSSSNDGVPVLVGA